MRHLKALLLIFLAVGIFYTVSNVPKFIIIKEIICQSQYGRCREETASELVVLRGKNYPEVKTKTSDVLGRNLYVKDYSFQLVLPDKLELFIIENKGEYALVADNGYLIADKDGLVIDQAEYSELPKIGFSEKEFQTGERLDQDELFACRIVSDVYSIYQVLDARIENQMLVVLVAPDIKVIFPTSGDRELLLGSLNLIFSQLKSSGNGTKISSNDLSGKTIDLRYRNPVIR